ncbi:hypothetical protein GQ53DRAFT_750253 [Thozetella sp. PMI_491]|nr:hypothetical protein GQ53DRAFT_750253 [Thozetella sp. PMI_491]
MAVLSETLVATQHQVQALQEQFFEISQANKVLVNEVVSLQKMVKAQSQVSNELISHLSTLDDRRRNSRHSAHSSHSSHSGPSYHSGGLGLLPDGADEPAAELRRAREILNGLSPDSHADRELERLSVAYHQTGSPPDSATSSVMFPQAGSMGMMHDPLSDMRHMVYPVGQTTGIDPFHSDHIHNIPYTRPLSNPAAVAEAQQQITPPPKEGSLWAKKPTILLVEDDPTCVRIGSKFLSHMDCNVDTAKDGLEAVNKINEDGSRYDLIFMDIIMPNLDGVSATAMIRVHAQNVPIIAMTSNIRQEDITTYFNWGMNDVLAKPFTRDGMIRILKKQLRNMLRDPPPPGLGDDIMPNSGPLGPGPTVPAQGPYAGQGAMNMTPMGGSQPMAGGGVVKFEHTPIQSPSTTASWHSPGQMSHTSPNLDSGGYMSAVGSGPGGMVLTPGGTQRPQYANIPQGPPPTMGRPPDIMSGHADDRPEKRQRLYGPGQGAYVQ